MSNIETQGTGSQLPKPSTRSGTGDGGIIRLAGLGFAGVWLIFLIIITVSTAVVIFGATQFQIRIASLTLGGGPMTVWKAEQLREQWIGSLERLEAARNALRVNQKALAAANAQGQDASIRMVEAMSRFRFLYDQVLDKIEAVDGAAATVLRDRPRSAAKLSEAVLQLKLSSLAMDELLRSVKAAEEEEMVQSQLAIALSQKVSNLQSAVKDSIEEFTKAQVAAKLQLPDQIPEDQRVQIENAIFEFHALQKFVGGVVYKLALAPSDILVLLLVIAMGVLGSSLQLSYIFVTEFGGRLTSYYIFRPFLGIITALVIFIVAKAGVPLITDTSRLGGNAPINPYFISFLAIISGFLSERALEALTQVGSNYFRGSETDEPRRWARDGLRAQFKTINRDPLSLISTLGVKQDELDGWLDGKLPVPPTMQKLLAAILDKPRRDLFTDFPPPNQEGKAGGSG